jgi:arabinose operon protein AraL
MMNDIKGYVFDLDGTIFRGNQLIEGADSTINFLRSIGKKIVFLSNRGNISRQRCKEKLLKVGIEAHTDEIILSSSVAASFLKNAYDQSKVWILGEKDLEDELRLAQVHLAKHPEEADWLLISLHETLTYHDLNHAFKAVASGARIIATNADKYVPTEQGNSIDVAGMIGAIESSTGRRVEIVVGKPSWLMAEAVLNQLGLSAEECLVVGDSMESDIAFGKMFGFKTTLVLTGSTDRAMATGHNYEADFTLESIKELKFLIEEGLR